MLIYLRKQYRHKGDRHLDREVFGWIQRPFDPNGRHKIDSQILSGRLQEAEVLWQNDYSPADVADNNLEIAPGSFKVTKSPPDDLLLRHREWLETSPANDNLASGCVFWSAFRALDNVKLTAALRLFDSEEHMLCCLMGWFEWFSASVNQRRCDFEDGDDYFEFLTKIVAPSVLDYLLDADEFPVDMDDFHFTSDVYNDWKRYLTGVRNAKVSGD